MTLLQFSAEHERLQHMSIDRSCTVPAGRSAANQPHAAAAVDRRDGRTSDRCIDPVLHIMQAASITLPRPQTLTLTGADVHDGSFGEEASLRGTDVRGKDVRSHRSRECIV